MWVGRALNLGRDEIEVPTALLPLSLTGDGQGGEPDPDALIAAQPTVNLMISHLASRSLPEEAPAEGSSLSVYRR